MSVVNEKIDNVYIEFNLDDSEVAERKEELLKEFDNRDILAADFKEKQDYYKTLIKEAESKIEKLRDVVKTGRELIRCEVRWHTPGENYKTITRSDNGQQDVETMDAYERKAHPYEPNLFNK